MLECIIFDLDGTLVDSEPLCNQAFLDLLPELSLPVEDLLERFRGRKLADILQDIQRLTDRELPKEFETAYRTRVEENFATSLKAFPGAQEVLQAIEIPICIASGGPQKKIMSALQKTGLDALFQRRTFSSYEVGAWKPDPGLFLFAASAMGVAPQACLVVEDSPVGIAAAKAAGMTPLQFCVKVLANENVESFSAYSEFAEKLETVSKKFHA